MDIEIQPSLALVELAAEKHCQRRKTACAGGSQGRMMPSTRIDQRGLTEPIMHAMSRSLGVKSG